MWNDVDFGVDVGCLSKVRWLSKKAKAGRRPGQRGLNPHHPRTTEHYIITITRLNDCDSVVFCHMFLARDYRLYFTIHLFVASNDSLPIFLLCVKNM